MLSKIIMDDGFCNHLVKDTALIGDPGIPMLVNMHNTEIPKDMIPFEKCRTEKIKENIYISICMINILNLF